MPWLAPIIPKKTVAFVGTMLIALAVLHHIDLSQSWMVGDRQTDIAAGTAAGCKTYLVNETHRLLDFAKMIKSASQ